MARKALTGTDAPVRDQVVDPRSGFKLTLTWEQWFQRFGDWVDSMAYSDSFWDDLRFPASGINPTGGASAPTLVTADPWAGTLLFGATGTDIIAGIAQLPHSWKIGTDLDPHIHWCPTSTNTGNVAWRFSYQVSSINGTFPAALTTAGIVVDAADGTTNKHQIHDFPDIDMSSITGVSAIVLWKLERVGSDASDTYTGSARFLELDFHYEIDSPGSTEEYVK